VARRDEAFLAQTLGDLAREVFGEPGPAVADAPQDAKAAGTIVAK
jgi:hypothetical protein